MTISPSYLHECFSYSPETGTLTWRARPRQHFATERAWKITNASVAGKPIRRVNSYGYSIVHLRVDGKEREWRAHRIIFAMQTGVWPVGEIDHKNRIKDDNRWINLRLATHAENQHNRDIQRNNTSGFSGVTRNKGRWQARINADGKRRNLGRFDSAEDAHLAYLTAKALMHPFSLEAGGG
jgi:hypothetical protein